MKTKETNTLQTIEEQLKVEVGGGQEELKIEMKTVQEETGAPQEEIKTA